MTPPPAAVGYRRVGLRLALDTVHFLLWVRQLLSWLAYGAWRLGKKMVKHKGTKLSCIVEDARRLDKVPLHLALIVGEERVMMEDIASAVCWAVAAGSQVVSLYDTKGYLKEHVLELQTQVTKRHQDLFSPPLPLLHVTTADGLTEQAVNDELKGSVTNGDHHLVVILSPDDSYSGLVQLTADLCHQAAHGRLTLKNIDPAFLNTKTQVSHLLPELNLAIVFSDATSLLGYPPWHTRLAEIMRLPSHHKLAYQDFHNLLQRYASCQQRLGK